MDVNKGEEQRCLLVNHNSADINSSEEEWSDDLSNDSYSSDTDSSIPEWESSVHDATGELTFIDCHPFVTQNIDNVKQKESVNPFSKNQLRHSTRGKFLRLIRRRESQRHSRRYQKVQDPVDSSTTKVKFHDSQEGEEKEVTLKMNTDSSHKLEQTSLSERLLGISVETLSDGNRIMIAGFLPDSEAKHEKNIKIGDWLKSINNVNVNYQNLNYVLHKLVGRSEVLLKLQRVAGVEVTKDPPINELNCQSRFVQEFVNFNKEDEQVLLETLCQYPVGLVYLNMEKLNESNTEYEDVIYCYPRPLQKSVLCQARGMFITLNHLINEVTNTKLQISSLLHRDRLCHVTYMCSNDKLLLFMVPGDYISVKEAVLIHSEIIRMLMFLYETLDKCFTTELYRSQVDAFLARFLMKVLNGGVWTTSSCITAIQDLQHKKDQSYQIEFENILPAAVTLHLPNEAYVQVDDALTELEASDYREWNEEPLDCQRLFTILGSALYHCGYLLASHLAYEDLIDVHIYCRTQGLFHLFKTEPVKKFVLWKEVFPHSCNRNEDIKIKIPLGKRYLLVVGSGKDLLAVIMEAGGCTEPAEENMGPDAFYVEEAQATLAHIQELGVSELASRWLASNPGPQVTIPETCNKRKSEFMDNLSRSVTLHKEPKKLEVTSILKRRNSDQTLVTHSSSFFSLVEDHCEGHSEDSGSQGGHSEISDDNSNNKKDRTKYDSNDEDSDRDDCGEGSQMSNSSFDISELRQSILSETEDFRPQQISSGKENVLFHFVQFDSTEGILVCPPECRLQSHTMETILTNFRKSCHKIHTLFQNTMRFKNMPAQDMAKSVMNKSLIAIKEYGVMFGCSLLDNADNRKNKIKYWVVGRLFYMPHPKEVYVCYQDSIPQNIIEFAFKIDLSTMN